MRCGVALGSNLGDRLAQLRRAAAELRDSVHSSGHPFLPSPVYETSPVDSEPDSPPFLNAVVELEFEGLPLQLLDRLQKIESAMGRPSRRPRNAPRPIDLDLLYAGNTVLNSPELVIPHPRLHRRRFVLQPLADLRPDLILPGRSITALELLDALESDETVRRTRNRLLP